MAAPCDAEVHPSLYIEHIVQLLERLSSARHAAGAGWGWGERGLARAAFLPRGRQPQP